MEEAIIEPQIVHLGMGGANGRGDNSIIDEHLSSSTGKRSTYGYI